MIQSSAQDSFKSIISSGEQIYELVKDQELTELENKLPDYTYRVKQYFLGLDREALIQRDIEDLKEVMSMHEMITNLLNGIKEEVSNNLKQLHSGKKMQNTYPQTHY